MKTVAKWSIPNELDDGPNFEDTEAIDDVFESP